MKTKKIKRYALNGEFFEDYMDALNYADLNDWNIIGKETVRVKNGIIEMLSVQSRFSNYSKD